MIASLHIQTNCNNGVTTLGKTYFTPPFKVANITEDKRSKWLQLMLMSSSPGVLDGDEYNMKIDLSQNSSLHLHTQSYQRLFDMKEGARQLMEVKMEKGSSFIYLPHPSVPHENSIFTANNKFYLTDECSLIWGEILTCGRKNFQKVSSGAVGVHSANTEIFKFNSYRSITEVFIHNKLVIKEHLFMKPSVIDPNDIGQLEGFTHQASLIHIGGTASNTSAKDTVYEYLSAQKGILSGVSLTGGNGLIVRILGYQAEQLYEHLKQVTGLLQHKPIPQETVYVS